MTIVNLVEDAQIYEISNEVVPGARVVRIYCTIDKAGNVTLKNFERVQEFRFLNSDPNVIEALIECFKEAVALGKAKRELPPVKVNAES